MKKFADLPKIDLHVHLDGSMRLDTVMEMAGSLPPEIRSTLPEDLKSALIPPERCSLEEYLEAFQITVATLQTEEALERAAYELCEDAANENVIYMEIRFAPLLHTQLDLKPRDVVAAVLKGMHRAEADFPIRTGLILSALKPEGTERSIEAAQLAAQFFGKGVVGFDLAGPERSYPPQIHHEAVEFAHAAGLHVTIHAGEGCCPEQIKEAVDLGTERIGHGVYLFKNPATEDLVAERGIPLEVCPTSNLQISGLMETYADHPLKRYLDLGIKVTVNPDNRLMSQIDLTHELEAVTEAFDLTREELGRILLTSAEAAFAEDRLKEELKEKIKAKFAD
ncbi:MAG TPA: adenosine deaminase [Candidatus Acetothermia bacterium]|nr:adenosine deaminase [Candidatus Acetothermia bacterium]